MSQESQFLRKYAAFTLLVVDEWSLDRPTESRRGMLLELMKRPPNSYPGVTNLAE